MNSDSPSGHIPPLGRPGSGGPEDTEERIDALVELWEDAAHCGKDLRVEDLCRDRPELLDRVAAEINNLKKMRPLFGEPDLDALFAGLGYRSFQ